MATAAEKRAEREAKKALELAKHKEEGTAPASELLNRAAMQRPDLVPSAGGEIAKPESAGAKVTVALKLGVAFFEIYLQRKVTVFEQNMQGGREIQKYERDPSNRVVRLRGTAYPRGTLPDGFPEKPTIIGGAALNPGVDKDFWDAWVAQNHLNPLVVNRMIFAHENAAMVTGQAKEEKDMVSGLEPINPKGDKRSPKSTRADVSNVETEELRAKKLERLAI